MNEAHSKQFSFKAKTSNNSFYKSPFAFNSKQLYSQTNSHFIPKQRSSSLPMNPPTAKENIYYDTDSKNQMSKRNRKHKIFDSFHSSLMKQDFSQAKVKVNQTYIKQSPKKLIKDQPRLSYPINLANERESEQNQIEKRVFQKQLEKNVDLDKSGDEIKLKLSLIERQKQVSYLKLQLQRYKRCESLNKQNEELYKKIVDKLSNSTKVVRESFQVLKRHQSDESSRTPISSLSDIKLGMANQQSSSKYQPLKRQISAIKVKNNNTEPLKTIPQNDENHVLLTENCTEGLGKSQSRINPNDLNETASKNKMLENDKQKTLIKTVPFHNNYFHIKMSEKMSYHYKRAPRVNFNEIPINIRLQYMNKAIQKSFQTQTKLSHKHDSPYKYNNKQQRSKSKYGSSFYNTNSKLDSSHY